LGGPIGSAKDLLSDINSANSTDVDLLLK